VINYLWCKPEYAIDAIYQACLETPSVALKIGSKCQTLDNLREFNILGIFKDGINIGGMIIKGKEFHIAVLSKYRGNWITKRFLNIVEEENKKRNGLYTTVNGASPLVEKAVLRFCKKYNLEVKK
jgi:GNAT superfamily N-acetyltransferase